jgi:hypothetical protein
MARTRTPKNDILSRVTDLGSEALSRLSEIPGGQRLAEMANESRTRLDEMQKKMRGLDALEQRVAKLERELSSSGGRGTTARKTTSSSAKTTARKTTSAAKTTARKTTAAGKSTARKASTPKKPPA